MTRCHFASAASQTGGGAQSLSHPAISPPALLRPNPTLSSRDVEAWPMDCSAPLAGDRSGTPALVPQSLGMAATSPGLAGRLLPKASRPRASPGTAPGSYARPAFRFLLQGLRDLGRRWRRGALQTHHPARVQMYHPGAWLPGSVGSAPGPGFGPAWQRVHGCAWVGVGAGARAATESRAGLRTVARGGARANSRSAAAGRAQAETGKACDWPPLAPMQTS